MKLFSTSRFKTAFDMAQIAAFEDVVWNKYNLLLQPTERAMERTMDDSLYAAAQAESVCSVAILSTLLL
jgi:hypothetical protein